jgi:hypothetical protein
MKGTREQAGEVLADAFQEQGYTTSGKLGNAGYRLFISQKRQTVAEILVTPVGIKILKETKSNLVEDVLDRAGLSREVRIINPGPPDFDVEEDVVLEMAAALDENPDRLSIDRSHLSDFGAGDVYEITSGNREWHVMRDSGEARELALAIVRQDLEQEPEIFNREFLERHIDMDTLRRELRPDVVNMRIEDLSELSPKDFWNEYESANLEAPEDEEGERRDPHSSDIEELAEKNADDQLRDPMEYLEDIYGREQAVTQAMRIAGINVDAAAEDAVRSDGPGHFLSHYDSELHETPEGFVYWREN